MIRRTHKTLATTVAFFLILSAVFVAPTPVAAASDDALMQCMVDCIMTEGEAEKATCKTRCANIPVNTQPEGLDCMATYKQCKKTCESDKDCKKVCKTALLNCV